VNGLIHSQPSITSSSSFDTPPSLQQQLNTSSSGTDDYPFESFTILSTIGTGTFGRVNLVQHTLTHRVFALKCLKKEDIVQFHQQKNIHTEKEILLLCAPSPAVSTLYATFNRPHAIYMLMEYIQGGELLTHLYDRDDTIPHGPHGGFTLTCLQFYLSNLLEAFLFFESHELLYRDLKPENVLLDRGGWIKIVDFGFAKCLGSSTGGGAKTYTVCGTQNYMAPEMILSVGYDRAVDYWALGCLAYELYLATPPFDAEFIVETYQLITSYQINSLPFPEELDEEGGAEEVATVAHPHPSHKAFVSLVHSLLDPDPSRRLGNRSEGVREIQRHPFFVGVDWSAVASRSTVPPYIPRIGDELDTSNFFDFDHEEGGEGGGDEEVPYEGPQDCFVDFANGWLG
jgi:cGMP-dependent protein kinase 1